MHYGLQDVELFARSSEICEKVGELQQTKFVATFSVTFI